MATTQISAQTPFGGMTNRTTAQLISTNTSMHRLQEAIATASSGYTGTPGTEFEGPGGLFGVVADPDPEAAGAKGTDYAYAVNQLAAQWATFWDAALPYIEQIDNGAMAM
jgi:hypothetical protein